MIARIGPVTEVQYTGATSADAYRSPLIPTIDTNALTVDAASLGLLPAVGTTRGPGLVPQRRHRPTSRSPSSAPPAAQFLGIDRVYPGERIWVGGQWFYVAGILKPGRAGPGDRHLGAGRLPGRRELPRLRRPPVRRSTCVPSRPGHRRRSRCSPRPPTPRTPNEVDVSQPSAALVARADAQSALNGLFLGLGAVALLVGGGRRRQHHGHLGPRASLRDRPAPRPRGHQGQHPHPVPARGDPARAARRRGRRRAGALATAIYATVKHWAIVIPPLAWAGGFGAAIAIGAVAGLLPALRAARMSPTEALRTA